MIPNRTDARAFLANPREAVGAVLLYGPDSALTASHRKSVAAAIGGPEAEKDMRLERIDPAGLRSDPAALSDALGAVGFFPGPRVVIVEDANDTAAAAITNALDARKEGDAFLIVTAGALKKTAKLRKLFEDKKRPAYCIALYPDPPGRADIEQALTARGAEADGPAIGALTELAHGLTRGQIDQLIETLSLYAKGETVTAETVALLAPGALDAETDEIVTAMAGGQPARIAPLMQRLSGQGVTPTTLVISAGRHLRQLHSAMSHPNGPDAGIGALRPPVFGPRRDAMRHQTRHWTAPLLERALTELTEADLALRSGRTVPATALVERCFIRIAMMPR
ncbi:DNA polymerase III subunit delta [Paracoccaceae bacterium GXU_MW_L88]